ncbi:MAG: ATP-dependent zinc metalloprotease FtsH [Planctomycetota bacterium]|jgi:cell division protease FtsH
MNEKQDNKPPLINSDKEGKKPQLPGYRKNPLTWLIAGLIVLTIWMFFQQVQMAEEIKLNEFFELVGNGHVKEVIVREKELVGTFTEEYVSQQEKTRENFTVQYHPEVHGKRIDDTLNESGIDYKFEQSKDWIWSYVFGFLPILLLFLFIYFIFLRNMRGGAGGMLMSFGRSKHRLHSKDRVKVTFKDVAGIEEAKEEVAEIIEFLKNPKKFQRLGGRIPRGVLLIGPPGCGKTLLAKAIAGQADVPFFSISGSDFVEMFVGVGASRVRDLFKQAKQNSPCIIFLDEIDAIGRKRGAGYVGGGHDEREQTLNAILVEMDGFETNDQVIVVAATNRSDILDHALTRPGRFDRQVVVPLPDLRGRADILKVHARKVKMGPNANLERLARGTPMFSGADLAAIINEAALAATMANKDHIELSDLEEARDKVRWGRAKKSRVIDQKEREIIAYHEAGHTLVQSLLEDADPLPEKDRTLFTKRYLTAQLQICFGGRIAEEMFCDDISSGAQNDIQQATNIARQMILTWGMSDVLGPINYGSESGFDNRMYVPTFEKEYSDKTAEEIDEEVKKITDQAYEQASNLMEQNKDKLENIAKALLKYETLDADDVKAILDGEELDKPTVADLLAAEKEKNNQAEAETEEQSESTA